MERIRSALQEIQSINDRFELSNDAVIRLIDEIATSKVCTPLIGKFSSGKSSLLNALLGYSKPLLKEAITPETAVPCEIHYQPQDRVQIVFADGRTQEIAVSEYRKLETDANRIKVIRLALKNEHFLANIPDVMLVDMPGFESGHEVHNRAIDGYLSHSLAYIVTFPADDMMLKTSTAHTLKELNLHDMPICVVITKRDKVTDEILEDNLAKLQQDLSRYIPLANIVYRTTSVQKDDVEELRRYLADIQEQSQSLLGNKYGKLVREEANNSGKYLKAMLQHSKLSLSELDEKEDALLKQIDALNAQIEAEKIRFASQIPTFVEEIQADVRSALQAEEPALVTMAINDSKIADRLNVIVRDAVTRSIQQRVLPKVQRYVSKLTDLIRIESVEGGFVPADFKIDTSNLGKAIAGSILAVVGLFVFGPLITFIGALLYLGRNKDGKREEMKEKIKHKLNTEIFPGIVERVGSVVNDELNKQITELNRKIENEISRQQAILDKALQDARDQRSQEKLAQEKQLELVSQNLRRIEEIQDGL